MNASHWDGDFPHPTLNQSASGSGGVGASNQELFSQRGAYLAPAVVGALDTQCGGGKLTQQSVANGHLIGTITARMFNALGARDVEEGALLAVTHTLRGEGFDAGEDGTGRGTPIVPVMRETGHGVWVEDTIAGTLDASMGASGHSSRPAVIGQAFAIQAGALRENPTSGPDGVGVQADHAYTLEARSEVQAVAFSWPPEVADPLSASEGKTYTHEGRGNFRTHNVVGSAVAFSCKDYGGDAANEVAPTLRSMGHDVSHANGGGQLAVACIHADTVGRTGDAITPSADAEGRIRLRPPGLGLACDGSSYNLMASGQPHAIATAMAVRRLTPRECERLQGFPDDYTLIPWRGKPADQCPDGPRYKALGNSMAVPCMRWIGERIKGATQ